MHTPVCFGDVKKWPVILEPSACLCRYTPTPGIGKSFTVYHTTSSTMSERIPPPTQALNTTTFVPPPLDLSLTPAELIDFHRIKDFPAHKPADGVTSQADTVLVTGTTGAIGSNALAELYNSPNVAKIVVLARKSPTPISVRRGRHWRTVALIQASLIPQKSLCSREILLCRASGWGTMSYWSSSRASPTSYTSVCGKEYAM